MKDTSVLVYFFSLRYIGRMETHMGNRVYKYKQIKKLDPYTYLPGHVSCCSIGKQITTLTSKIVEKP